MSGDIPRGDPGGVALSAPADLVRRLDPDHFHAALFAPEPARERLMVLTAFDIELSRATAKAGGVAEGPMLAAMRLQFWRDRVEAAAAGKAPAAHQVVEPLHDLLTGPLGDGGVAETRRLIDGRDCELQTPLDDAGFEIWADARFGAWHRLVLHVLGLRDTPGASDAAAAAGAAAARAFAIRNAVALAGEGRALLPEIEGEAQGRLARGDVTPETAAVIARLSAEGRAALRKLRQYRGALGRAAAPAFLPLWRAERDLRAAADGLPGGGHPLPARVVERGHSGRAAAYLWRTLSGRW
ncbi:MAG: squalene/phytoene synthase family protein [Pseudomonadota bacterium]